MTSPRPGSRRARLASVLVALWVALAVAGTGTPRAHAADPAAARITLTAAVIDGDTLRVSGRLTNTGTAALTDVSVDLWRSTALLRSATAVERALAATTTTTGTARVVEPSNTAVLAEGDAALAPGDSLSFTVSGSLAALGLTATNTTWWVGVDADASTGASAASTIASARTLVTRPSGDVPVVTVVELSSEPRQLKQDLFLDDSLAAEIADGGRLDALLDLVEERDTDWLVDPSLAVELADMADGYYVRVDGANVAGEHGDAARAFLDRIAALPADRGARGLLGSPDLTTVAALADGVLTDAIQAASATDVDALAGLPTVAVVDDPDAAALTLADRLADTLVIVDADVTAPLVRVGDVTALAARTDAPAAPTSPLLADTPLTASAVRFALARVAGGEVRWVREADEAPDAALPQGFTDASLADVAALDATTAEVGTPDDAAGALDAARLARVRALRERMIAYGSVSPDTGIGHLADTQTARAASRWWTGDADALDAWLDGLEGRLGGDTDALVSVDASARFSMAGATSEFPVTVTNHLTDPVTVQVVVRSDNPQRITLTDPAPVTIPAGSSSTVLLGAEAAGGGVVQASVHVETLDGHRLTPDRTIAVETTMFGTIGWVLVITSGVVLVVTTAHRIRQVRGRRKGEDG